MTTALYEDTNSGHVQYASEAIIQCQCQKHFFGGPVCWQFKSEAPAAEEMLDRNRMQPENSSVIRLCLESGDGSRTFGNWRHRFPYSWCRDTECFGLEVDPCRRL